MKKSRPYIPEINLNNSVRLQKGHIHRGKRPSHPAADLKMIVSKRGGTFRSRHHNISWKRKETKEQKHSVAQNGIWRTCSKPSGHKKLLLLTRPPGAPSGKVSAVPGYREFLRLARLRNTALFCMALHGYSAPTHHAFIEIGVLGHFCPYFNRLILH